jgi:uncharacterized protein (DUF305 family)
MNNLSENKKLIIVGILALIIGASLTQLCYSTFKDGYKDFRNDDRGGMMMGREGYNNTHMGMHQMPDGSMMGNMGGMDMDSMMQGMVANMKGKTGKDLEKAFLVDMIPHHQGAVEMAKMLVADPTVSAELRAFAQQIITAQEGEIKKMNVWVKKY